MYSEENKIIKDLRVLTEQFIPSRLVHRDGQLKVIRDNLQPIVHNKNPRNMFLHGPPGVGKTCIANFVVEELKKYVHVFHTYINCWSSPSRFKILYSILNDLGESLSVHRKGTPTDELLEVLERRIKNNFCVFILDEVDQLEDDKILYDLVQYPNVGLLLIANEETALYKVDPRIRSRFAGVDEIAFPAYKTSEIIDIIKDRVEWGLLPSAIKNAQIETIAEHVTGDARAAINILRTVAGEAENNDYEKITDELIEQTIPKAQNVEQSKIADSLNAYQNILLTLVREKKQIKPETLYTLFAQKIKESSLDEINERTIRKYLEKLVKYDLIEAKGDGRWRTYLSR